MTKFIINWKQKGWFKALGLHHAALTTILITIGWLVSVGTGAFFAAFAVGWYGSREYGNGPWPPVEFEILDFLSPTLVAAIYLTAWVAWTN